MKRILPPLLILALALALGACKTEVPEPWKSMVFPVANSDILPGANDKRFKVKYRNIRKPAEYFREWKSALVRGGFTFMEEAPNDDPAEGVMAAFFLKGETKVRLTVYADAHTHAEVKVEEEH